MKLFLLLFSVLSLNLHAYTLDTDGRDFSVLYNNQLYGQSIAIGNTVLCPQNSSGECTEATTHNNYVNLKKITNSEANLTIPYNNYQVLKAYLFWQGRSEESTNSNTALTNFDEALARTIKLKLPGNSTFTTINLNATDILDRGFVLSNGYDLYTYSCATEITSLIDTNNAQGLYTITDLYTKTGDADDGLGYYGAWTIVFVVEDLDQTSSKIQDISIYNGYKTISSASNATINIDGFLTPRSTTQDVNAELTVFTAEGDLLIEGDQLRIKEGNATSANPDSDFTLVTYNGGNTNNTFASNISGTFYRNPSLTNNNAIDLHTIEVGKNSSGYDIIGHNLSEASIRLTSDGDSYFASMLTFSVQLYEPSFCYDYAYSQNGSYFTEDNNGSFDPYVTGTVVAGTPIETTIYLRNLEADILAENGYLIVKDINTTQAELLSDGSGFSKTAPGEVLYQTVSPVSVTSSAFNLFLATTIAENQGVYAKFSFDPVHLNQLNFPLNAYFDYEFTVNGKTIHLPERKLTRDIPLCSSGPYIYAPDWGVFNVLDTALNTTGSLNPDGSKELNTDLKYNLFTQVAKRPYAVEIVSFDANNLDTVRATNDFFAVELIDAAGFHYLKASCDDYDASASKKVWVPFTFGDANITNKTLDSNYLATAITNGLTSLTSASEFYEEVHQNSAFRIWIQEIKDANGDLLKPIFDTTGTMVKADFATIRTNYTCSNVSLSINDECAGNNGDSVSLNTYKRCMECIFSATARPLCSRDNFSSRPESFDMKISDINHSEANPDIQASTKISIPTTATLAAGYAYRFDINATSHTDNVATKGYDLDFTDDLNLNVERNASFNWSPVGTLTCNDSNASVLDFHMSNGAIINSQRFHNNVGRYNLAMVDSSFTKADQIAIHHVAPYFLTTPDCLLNDSSVPTVSSASDGSNLGCNISSEHTNVDYPATLSTSNYDLTFVPYKFVLNGFKVTSGKSHVDINTTNFVYMSDMNTSMAMAVHYEGDFQAQGENNSSLSNFVTGCYAQDLDFSLEHNASAPTSSIPQFQYAYSDNNISHNIGASAINTSTSYIMTLPSISFDKDNNGTIPNFQLHFNYERNSSDPKEILELNLSNLDGNCSTVANCQSRADLTSTHAPSGTFTADNNVTFAFGRVHAPRYRINGKVGDVTVFYEVYCKTSNCQAYNLTQESVDDVFWYINPQHTDQNIYGDFTPAANNIAFTNPLLPFDNLGRRFLTTTFDETPIPAYPFKTKVRMTPDPWLIFNKYNANATSNDFVIEYYKTSTNWSGKLNNASTVDSNASKTTNRRINW